MKIDNVSEHIRDKKIAFKANCDSMKRVRNPDLSSGARGLRARFLPCSREDYDYVSSPSAIPAGSLIMIACLSILNICA